MADLHSHLFLVIFATDINFIVVFFRKITVICAFITAIALFAQNNLCADSVEASLLICSPGHNVYELEGHATVLPDMMWLSITGFSISTALILYTVL